MCKASMLPDEATPMGAAPAAPAESDDIVPSESDGIVLSWLRGFIDAMKIIAKRESSESIESCEAATHVLNMSLVVLPTASFETGMLRKRVVLWTWIDIKARLGRFVHQKAGVPVYSMPM